MLIDSNIIIYAMQSQHDELRRFIGKYAPAVSAVSYVEVLGYHKLNTSERTQLQAFFDAALVLQITEDVLRRAVQLRQSRRMKLGDALIAATALVAGRTLVTGNIRDFKWIQGLRLLSPSDASSGA